MPTFAAARRRAALPALILALALGLAACGDSAEEEAVANAEALAAEARSEAEAISNDVHEQVSEQIDDAQSEVEQALSEAEEGAAAAAGQLSPSNPDSGGLEQKTEEAASPEPAATETAAPTAPAPAPAAELAGGQFAIAGIPDALTALRQAVGAETFELLEVKLVQQGRITFQVRDPEIPENVDQYEWDGTAIGAPVPVQLVGGGDLSASVFPVCEVMQVGAQGGYDAAVGLELEGGVIAPLTLRINPFDGLAWAVPVSGTRESKVVYASTTGEVIRVV